MSDKFIYLVVDLGDGTVHGTNDAEEVQPFLVTDEYLVICTTGDQHTVHDGEEMVPVEALDPDTLEGLED